MREAVMKCKGSLHLAQKTFLWRGFACHLDFCPFSLSRRERSAEVPLTADSSFCREFSAVSGQGWSCLISKLRLATEKWQTGYPALGDTLAQFRPSNIRNRECKSFYSMGGNWIIKWAVIRLKGWRNSFYLSLQRHSSPSAGRF